MSNILTIHKKIVPITILQVKEIAQKSSKIIHVALVVSSLEMLKALQLQKELPKKIKGFHILTDVIYEEELPKKILNSKKSYDVFYIFDVGQQSFKELIDFSIKNKVLTFSNSFYGLENGSLLYIDLEDKIKIYINKNSMKSIQFTFDSRFLRMVKIYE
jgi:hypothetical protein